MTDLIGARSDVFFAKRDPRDSAEAERTSLESADQI
jgi:hypothetical protein